jgi:hypothetical protein
VDGFVVRWVEDAMVGMKMCRGRMDGWMDESEEEGQRRKMS